MDLHLFLLAGQSNMAGRGVVEEEDKRPHPRVLALDAQDRWAPAIDPIHFDKPVAGVCLGRTFGIILAENDPEISVGLIPCACGGSPISAWAPGQYWEQTKGLPYDDALRRAKIAMQDGALKGILWHQGESDSTPDLAPVYEERLHALINRFRTELNVPDVPFIAGQLACFPDIARNPSKEFVNSIFAALPRKVPHAGFVSAEGLKHKGDKLHFDAASLREFGRRYAEAYFKLAGRANPSSR